MVRYRFSKPQYTAEFERQSDEWEEVLKDVTVEPSTQEVPVDPSTLSNIQTRITFQDLQDNPNQRRPHRNIPQHRRTQTARKNQEML